MLNHGALDLGSPPEWYEQMSMSRKNIQKLNVQETKS